MHDTELAREATREDIEGGRGEHAPTLLLWGTAGWDGVDEVVNRGTSTNGARNLARVTLFVGKPPGIKAKPNVAQGHQVLVQLTGPVLGLPVVGMQVQCSFPGGDVETPGNGTILNWALGDQKAPNVTEGDALLLAPGGFGNFFRARADGRLELSALTADGNLADVSMTLDPGDADGNGANGTGLPGRYMNAPWGTEIFNKTGYHLATQWGACVDFSGSSGGVFAVNGLSSYVKFRSSQFSALASAVKLGSSPGTAGQLHQPVAIASGPFGIGLTGLVPILAQVTALETALTVAAQAVVTAAPVTEPALVTFAGAIVSAMGTLASAVAALSTAFSGTTTALPFASQTTSAV